MKKKLCLSLVLALMLSMLAACNSGGSKDNNGDKGSDGQTGGTLIVQMSGDPVSLNPNLSADDNLYSVAQNMYNRLVKLDASKNVIGDLASSWDISDDAKTITFHLKKNAKWWDGKPVTADDVAYTFNYIKENDTCYFSSKMVDVDSIEATDQYTVVFHMAKADVSFVARLGWYGTFILPKHVFDNGQPWEENVATKTTPVGSGPFMFEEYKQGESVTLKANPNYHDAAPKLDKVKFSIIPDDATAVQALLNGEVDSISYVPDAYIEQLKADFKYRLILNEYPSPVRIIFNLKNEKVSDIAVRQAIAYCIDRESISNKVYGETMPPEYSAYPSMIKWASNTEDTYPKADVKKAVEILEAAGYTKDANGFYVTGITLDVFDSMNCPDVAKLIAASCKEAGIEINVQVSEYNAWFQKVSINRDFIIEMQGGFMGPDPSALRDRIGSGQASNYGFYSNAEVDDYLAKAVATGDQDERAKNFKAVQKILVEELPYINIVAYAQYEGANAKAKNLPIDGAGKWGWSEYTYTYFEK